MTTTRWDFLKEGDEYFFGAAKAPADFHVLYVGNECHAAFCRNPVTESWLVLFNGLFYPNLLPGVCKTTLLSGELTIVEAKVEVEKLCQL
jgi:hypothetical protein